jgi:two-component system, cell cycle response regulator
MSALSQRFRVLTVDDSAVARKLVETALSGGQYELVMARSGQEALKIFAKERPGLVITDWVMPDLSGVELCQRIRAESESFTYVILLTSIADKSKLVSGLRSGADDYLTKPFEAEELLARVEVGCRIVGLHHEIEAKSRLLEQLALTDTLTTLPNRLAVETWGMKQFSGARRHDFSFWAVLADLDEFKRVNDTCGHDAGDTVLKKFAEILKANTRQSDMCGRVGGDEFLIFIAHAERPGVEAVVERIRQQLEEHTFVFGSGQIRVTASFGIARFRRGSSESFDQIVARADVALYSAKRLGRNRVRLTPVELAL